MSADRFSKRDAELLAVLRAEPRSAGGAPAALDVHEAVSWAGGRAVAVQIFGRRVSVDGEGNVKVGGGSFRLARVRERWCLVPRR